MSRDLGMIAAGQLALHYWIVSFGKLGNYAAKLGLTETEHSMRTSLDEAKQAGLQHTALAEKILVWAGSKKPAVFNAVGRGGTPDFQAGNYAA